MSLLRRARIALEHGLLALLWFGLPCGDARADALIELKLETPPHAPGDAPDVIVHVPTRIAAKQPLHVVVFLHGYSSCARALVASEPAPCTRDGAAQRAYQLARIHEQAHGNSILLVPQLAFVARDSSAPRFAASGGFDAMLHEVRARLGERLDSSATLASVTLVAHSAGYKAAATILSDPSLQAPVANVVLFDALYGCTDVFAAFVLANPKRRLISLYTRDRSTTRGNKRLAAQLGHRRGEPARIVEGQLTQERVETPHGLIPTRHFAATLDGLL
jgi:hypothetical protein